MVLFNINIIEVHCIRLFDECKCAKQINSASSLESVGTLVAGVPSETIKQMPTSALLNASQSSTFVSNMLQAPTVVQQTFVNKVQN